MTKDEIDQLVREFAPVIREYVAKEIAPLAAALAPMKERIAHLEGKAAWAPKPAPENMSLQEAFDVGFEAVKEFLDRELAKFENRIAENEKLAIALSDRVVVVESFKYLGTWDAERRYEPGNFVSSGGSLWHCLNATRARPGDGADWQLAVKRGQDGKDAGR